MSDTISETPSQKRNIIKAITLMSLRRRKQVRDEETSSDRRNGRNSRSGSNATNRGASERDESNVYELESIGNISDVESELFFKPPAKQSKKISMLVGIFVAVGGFLFGYDTGLINNVTEMPYVKETFAPNGYQFTAEQMSILVSFLSLGTFFGALTAPFISDTWGRKATVIFSTFFVFMVGNSLQVAATSMTLLVIGRVISGISIGLISAVVPLYQGEAALKSVRGAIISTYQWAITWGLLVASAVSQGTRSRPNASSYRIPIGLQYIWSFVLGLGIIFLPESPRYYVLKDQLDKAAKSLSFLRGVPEDDSGLLEELVEIKATYDYEMSFGNLSYLDCFRSSKSRSKQRLRMLTGIAIQAFQQFSGINFIFYYGVNFFNKSGIIESYTVSLITYAVNVAFNIPGLFLVEYMGRRKLLLSGGVLMTISNFIIAIVGSSTNSVVANNVMIAFICMFIASFSATWGGGVWVISAELYPLGVRAKCTAICAASNWLINFICALMTPYLFDTGNHTTSLGTKIFFLWGSLNALGTIVVYFAVYETSGLTLEQIDELYQKSSSGINSRKWNKEIRNAPDQYHLRRKQLDELQHESHEKQQAETLPKISTRSTDFLESTHLSSSTSHLPPPGSSLFRPLTSSETSSVPQQITPQQPNYVDLGNGLGFTTYTRGPPSTPSDSSDDEDSESIQHSTQQRMEGLNQYMAQLMRGRSEDDHRTADPSTSERLSESVMSRWSSSTQHNGRTRAASSSTFSTTNNSAHRTSEDNT